MKKIQQISLMVIMLATGSLAQARRPITFEDLMKVQRISDPQVSPDGRWVAYVQGTVNFEANKIARHIWLVSTEGGEPRQLTRGEGLDTRPRWSPDGQSLAFISNRGGKSQVWLIPANGGEARQLTTISTEADGVVWSRKSDWLAFTSKVYPHCPDDDCNQERLDYLAKSKVKALLIEELLFRHWDGWREGRYAHVFAVSAKGGKARDLTPGPYDSPTWFLDAPDGYAISPDGKEVCYTSNRTGRVAWSTNDDIYCVDVSTDEVKNITKGNPGSDGSPQYSPDGQYIAYTSQAREGYEADLSRLRAYDRQTGNVRDLTPGFDQWVASFAWAPDSDTIYFTAPDRGQHSIFNTSVSAAKVVKVLDGYNDEVQVTPGGRALVFTRSSLTQPAEVYRLLASGGVPMQLTHANDALIGELELNPAESATTKDALGAEIHSLLVKPPEFDAHKKYPGLLLIHGGPQSAWSDTWGYRWNAQLFAARGYVVMMPNPHGSTGYGQKFVEQISGDWGGAHYEELMAAADHLESLPYVDKTRVGAAGASFGGFMVNWIAGHTRRFKALVSHAGVYDQRSMYGATEELWFPEWEFKGVPWEKPELFEKWSPSNFVQNIQTPMLIVHGALDFRVPIGQGLQIFSALQRRGVPSKFLYFPDEGHWILKPRNSQLWYETVLGWLDEHLK